MPAPSRPRPVDVALTLALLAWAVVEAVTAHGPGTLGQRLVYAVGVTAPVLWRRRAPLWVVAALLSVLMVRIALMPGMEDSTFPFPSLLVATFSAALYAERRWSAAAAGVATVVAMLSMFPLGYYGEPDGVGQVVILGFFVCGAWGAGWLVRRRADSVREAERATGEAVAEERARIAREIHDVVAHSLSIVAVQAGAAEALIDAEPETAREHIAAARRTAREALAEMRHVLDVTGGGGGLAPQPTLERVADLVDDVRDAGLPVTLTVDGIRGPVPAGVDLAAFRIVQEALTNVRRHAGNAPTTVRLGYDAEGIDIEVSNAMPAGVAVRGAGRGLVGMRERARLYGGTVFAGPDGDRFAVRARLPWSTS
ncbi:sensor histidine kinase [Phytohabitans kaempferiae]|uniref:histidine kinase n=1 Tax=Phytohabitans kaempferiae TaxID=1620943 RepID=A0ABV6LYL6_9ACTN